MGVKKLFDLSGRSAIITGGSRGLGLQMAEALGEMGAKVAITARKQDELDAAVAQLKRQGIDAAAWACDIGRREAIAPVAEAILKKYAKVDILVNNAGATWGAPAEDHPIEAWDKLVSVNLSGMFVLTQLIAKRNSCSHRRWPGVSGTARPRATLTAWIASSGLIPEMARTPAAIKPDRPMPWRQCTTTFFPSSNAVAILAISETAAGAEVGTPRSGMGTK